MASLIFRQVQFYIPFYIFTFSGETFQGYGLESGSSISFYTFGTLVANASLFRSVTLVFNSNFKCMYIFKSISSSWNRNIHVDVDSHGLYWWLLFIILRFRTYSKLLCDNRSGRVFCYAVFVSTASHISHR